MDSRVLGLGVAVVVTLGVVAAPASASDKTTAKQLVVKPADAGSSYTAAKSSPSSEQFPKIAACVGTSVSKRVVTAHLAGPDLTNSQDGSLIKSSVDFVKTAAIAKTDRAVASNARFADCLAQVAKAALSGQGVTGVSAQRVTVKRYGSYSTAIETQVSGTSNSQPFTLTVVQVGIFKGRAELSASFFTNGTQPFDQTQGQAILDKVNQRLKHAMV